MDVIDRINEKFFKYFNENHPAFIQGWKGQIEKIDWLD